MKIIIPKGFECKICKDCEFFRTSDGSICQLDFALKFAQEATKKQVLITIKEIEKK